MKPAPFTYHRPGTVAEAVDLLAALAPEGGRVLAGGQSLVPLMAFRLTQPTHLIDINRVADFGALRLESGVVRVPATVRHADFAPQAVPAPLGPSLAKVARHIAHLPIRLRGTFCGSLAHADPSAEWPTVFVALGGEAVARSCRGERVVRAEAFCRGIMTTALEADEVLAEARLPLPAAHTRVGFCEVSRRAGDYAMAMAVACLGVSSGVIEAPVVAVGAVEPVPRRIASAEVVLRGQAPEDGVFRRAADAAADGVDPMEDAQVSAGLRRNLVRAVVRRALRDAMR